MDGVESVVWAVAFVVIVLVLFSRRKRPAPEERRRAKTSPQVFEAGLLKVRIERGLPGGRWRCDIFSPQGSAQIEIKKDDPLASDREMARRVVRFLRDLANNPAVMLRSWELPEAKEDALNALDTALQLKPYLDHACADLEENR